MKYTLVYTDEILHVAANYSPSLVSTIETRDEIAYSTLFVDIASPEIDHWSTEEEDCGTEDYWISFITSWRGVPTTVAETSSEQISSRSITVDSSGETSREQIIGTSITVDSSLAEKTGGSEIPSIPITVDSSFSTTQVSPSYIRSSIAKSSDVSQISNHTEITDLILSYTTAPTTVIPSVETSYKNTTTKNDNSIFTNTQSDSIDTITPIHQQSATSFYPNNVPTKRRGYSAHYSRYTLAVPHNRTIRFNHGNLNIAFSNITVLLVCLALILMLM